MLAIEASWVVGSGYWKLHQPIISPEQVVRSVLLPLVIGSFFIGFLYLVYARSTLTLKRDANEGSVFTGFGPFGKKQEFRWSAVKSVELRDHNIVLMTDTTIQFGAAMRDDHRQYLLRLIQAQLADATF